MAKVLKLHHKSRGKLERLCAGRTPARIAKRARILLCSHEGMTIDEIAETVQCGTATVKRVRRRFHQGGYEFAILDAPKSGRPRKISERDEKRIIALACTTPPDGRARWTIRMLAKHSDPKVSFGTVYRILKEDGFKPWLEKNVVRAID